MESYIKRVLTTSLSAALISGAVLAGLSHDSQKALAAVSGINAPASRSLPYPRNFYKIKNREAIVNFAKKYLGARYSYGSSGPKAFDCSGFTMYVMGNFGIRLPHSARSQSKYGQRVSREELRPADLVFFSSSRGGSISHVGMYVGNGYFIHASSSSRGVRIDSLSEGYYRRHFVTAVRLFR